MKRARYTIEPLAEFNGEGGGWDDASDEQATIFAVFDNERGEQVASCDTRAEAELFISMELVAEQLAKRTRVLIPRETFQSTMADTDEPVTVRVNPDGTFSI